MTVFLVLQLLRSGPGRVSRASPVHTVVRNCTRDEGGPFGFGDQEPISSHRKLLRAKAVVVSVAETHGRERRPQHLLVFQVNIIPDTEEGRQQKSLRRVVAKK